VEKKRERKWRRRKGNQAHLYIKTLAHLIKIRFKTRKRKEQSEKKRRKKSVSHNQL
jgi:hypothetical protein